MLSHEQIYNVDETALYWCHVRRKTLTTVNETATRGFNDAKERLIILGSANAAGTHNVNLVVIGIVKHPIQAGLEENCKIL